MTDTPETILSQLSFANRSLERGDWKGASEEQDDRLLSLVIGLATSQTISGKIKAMGASPLLRNLQQ